MAQQRKELEELQRRQQQGQHRHRQPPPPTQNTRFVSFEHGEEVNTALPPSYGPRRTTVGSVPNMTPSAQTMGGLSSWDAPAAKATAATAAPPPGLSSSWNLPPAQAPSTRTNTGLPSTSSLFGGGLFGGFNSTRVVDGAGTGGRSGSQASIGSVGSGRGSDLSVNSASVAATDGDKINDGTLHIGSLLDDDVDLLDNAALDGLLGALDDL